jgi:hypothetical protein
MLEQIWSKVSDFLKARLTTLIGLAIACAVIAFLPDAAIETLGLTKIRQDYQPFVGLAAIVFTTLSAVEIAAKAISVGSTFIKRQLHANEGRKRLRDLTPEEKQVLCNYVLNDTRTQTFQMQDGVIQGLCRDHILYPAAPFGEVLRGMAYNIEPWAWEYLRKHPDLITTGVPKDAQGKVLRYAKRRKFGY